MEQLPNQQTPQTSQPRTMRVVHISVQPKTWFGKFIAGSIGVAVMLVAFFLSILAFAIFVSIVLVAIIYFLWATRHSRCTLHNENIDGKPQNHNTQ